MPAGSAFWAVPPLTSPELDAGNCGGRRWARRSSAQREGSLRLPTRALITAVQIRSDGYQTPEGGRYFIYRPLPGRT